MLAATLSRQLSEQLIAIAWDQWAQMGISAAPPEQRSERAADPEALLLLTLQVARHDPRLFDETCDWLTVNESLISVHRLRGLCETPMQRALVDAAVAWAVQQRRPRNRSQAAGERSSLELLFFDQPEPSGALDPIFAAHGFARPPLDASRKSQAPKLTEPINFAFRLRRLLGVGVRAEVIRTLLTVRASRLSSRVLAASAGFAQRNVREGLSQLTQAGVIFEVLVAGESHYSIDFDNWAALLGLPRTPDLPLHFDWIHAFRALTRVSDWLAQNDPDQLSDYLLASQARTLFDQIAGDLRYAGMPHLLDPAPGPRFWDEFAAVIATSAAQLR